MLALYHETQAPSAVRGSVWFRPTSSDAPLLAVARSAGLDVYRVHAVPANATPSKVTGPIPPQLHLVTSVEFSGSVRSLEVLTLSGSAARAAGGSDAAAESGQDALLLTFEGAKTSLLGLDPFSLTLKTLAMLNFDEAATGPGSGVRGLRMSIQQPGVLGESPARVDPLNRMAAVGVYDGQIAMLPVAGSAAGGLDDDAHTSTAAYAMGSGGSAASAVWARPQEAQPSSRLLGVSGVGDSAAPAFGSGAGAAPAADGVDAASAAATAAAAAAAAEEAAASAAAQDALSSRFFPSPYILNLRTDLDWADADVSGVAGGVGTPAAAATAAAPAAMMAGTVAAAGVVAGAGATTAASTGTRIPDRSVHTVLDMGFLHGHGLAPALALLSQQYAASPSRLGSIGHTCAVTVVSAPADAAAASGAAAAATAEAGLSAGADGAPVPSRKHPVVWRREGLPADAFAILPVPGAAGGLLLLSPHAVLFLSQNRVRGVALNAYAAATVDTRQYPLAPAADAFGNPVCTSIGGAGRAAALSPTSFLVSAADGALVLLQLQGSGSGSGDVSGISVTVTGLVGPPAAAIAALPSDAATAARLRAADAAADAAEASLAASGAATPIPPLLRHAHYGLLFLAAPTAASALALFGLRDREAPGWSGSGAGSSSAAASAAGALLGHASDGSASGAAPSASPEDEDAAIYAGAGAAAAAGSASGSGAGAAGGGAAAGAGAAAAAVDEDEDAFLYGGSAAGAGAAGGSSGSAAAGAAGGAGVGSMAEDGTGTGTGSGAAGAASAASAAAASRLRPLRLWLVDSLPSLAPVADVAYGRECRLAGADDESPPNSAPATELVAVAGEAAGAGVAVVHRCLRPEPAIELKLPGCVGAWFVRCRPQPVDAEGSPAAAAAGAADVDGEAPAAGSGPSGPSPSGFVVLSMASGGAGGAGSTRIFHIGESLVECTGDRGAGERTASGNVGSGEYAAGFAEDTPTLAVGAVFNGGALIDVPVDADPAAGADAGAGAAAQASQVQLSCSGRHSRFLQVHASGVRLLSGDPKAEALSEMVRNLPLDVGGLGGDGAASGVGGDGDPIASVDILDPYVLLRLGSGRLRLLRPDTDGLQAAAAAAAASGAASTSASASADRELDLVVDTPPWESSDSSSGSGGGEEPLLPLPEDDATAAGIAADGSSAPVDPALAAAAARRLARRVVAACLFRDDAAGTFMAACRGTGAAASQGKGQGQQRAFAAVVCRNGDLSVHALPSWERVFAAPGLHLGPSVLASTLPRHATATAAAAAGGASESAGTGADASAASAEDAFGPLAAPVRLPRVFVRELSARVCPDSGSLHLVALTSRDDVLAYAFLAGGSGALTRVGPAAAAVDASAASASSVPFDCGLGAPSSSFADGSASSAAAAAAALAAAAPEEDNFDFGGGSRGAGGAGSAGGGAGDHDDFDAGVAGVAAAAAAAGSAAGLRRLPALTGPPPLQHVRALAPRFVRVAGVSALQGRAALSEEDAATTAAAAAAAVDPHKPPAEEALHRFYSPRRLVHLSNASGWNGWAILTPAPLWLLQHRGSLLPVRVGVTDATGAGGPAAVPGDMLQGAGTPLLSVCPLSSASLPDGMLIAHASGHLHFARLPRPAWPTAAPHAASGEDALTVTHGGGASRVAATNAAAAWPLQADAPAARVPFGLLSDSLSGDEEDGASATGAAAGASSAGGAPALAMAAAEPICALVRSLRSAGSASHQYHGLGHPQHHGASADAELPTSGSVPLSVIDDASASHMLAPPVPCAGSGSSVEALADALPGATGGSTPGATLLLQRRLYLQTQDADAAGGGGGAPQQLSATATPRRVAFMELASAAAGAAAVSRWHARRLAANAAAAAAASTGGAAPAKRVFTLPPTQSQLGCSVYPLYALAASLPVPRDHAGELAMEMAEVAAEGGEHEGVPYGPHVELLDAALAGAAGGSGATDPTGASAAVSGAVGTGAGSHAAQLSSIAALGIPEVADGWEEVLLVAGSGAPDPALEPLEAPAQGGYGSSAGWTVLDRFRLRRHERVTALREVPMVDRPGAPPTATLIVGTATIPPRGQDGRTTGRILVFRIHDRDAPAPAGAAGAGAGDLAALVAAQDAAAGKAATAGGKLRLAQVCEMRTQAPVVSIAPLAVKDVRHVILGVGSALTMYAWKSRAGSSAADLGRLGVVVPPPGSGAAAGTTHFLEKIAGAEGHSLARDIATVGQYVLTGDALSGARFLQWREEDRRPMVLARDPCRQAIASCELLVHDKTLGLVSADEDGNVLLHAYAPREAGSRLITRADVRLPSPFYRMIRGRFAVPVGTPTAARKKFCVVGGSIAGGLGCLVPLEEPLHKRLAALQRTLLAGPAPGTPFAAGLNPRLWRALDTSRHPARERVGGVLDGPLLLRFTGMDARAQRRIAAAAGFAVDALLDALRSVDIATVIF